MCCATPPGQGVCNRSRSACYGQRRELPDELVLIVTQTANHASLRPLSGSDSPAATFDQYDAEQTLATRDWRHPV